MVTTVTDLIRFLCAQVDRRRLRAVVVSFREPVRALLAGPGAGSPAHSIASNHQTGEIMEPASPRTPALPNDLLLVEDDPIIALDFEDTILALGVKTVRTAAGVARALQLIAERAPDFALLDVSLVREKSFAIAERLDALKIPFAFVTGYGADVRLPQAFAERPRLAKPCSTEALETVLKLHAHK
jgi:CheY-like chemotaxis protein